MTFTRIISLIFLTIMFQCSASYAKDMEYVKTNSGKVELIDVRKINLHRAIERYTKQYRLPSEELFASLLIAESSLNPCAVSIVGAAGLSQLMPETAKNIGVTDRFEIHQSLWGGASILKSALNLTNGDITKSLGLYNWGSKSLTTPFDSWPIETRNYVEKVSKTKEKLKTTGWKNYIPEYIHHKDRQACSIS